jgi:hypothetical protein
VVTKILGLIDIDFFLCFCFGEGRSVNFCLSLYCQALDRVFAADDRKPCSFSLAMRPGVQMEEAEYSMACRAGVLEVGTDNFFLFFFCPIAGEAFLICVQKKYWVCSVQVSRQPLHPMLFICIPMSTVS